MYTPIHTLTIHSKPYTDAKTMTPQNYSPPLYLIPEPPYYYILPIYYNIPQRGVLHPKPYTAWVGSRGSGLLHIMRLAVPELPSSILLKDDSPGFSKFSRD